MIDNISSQYAHAAIKCCDEGCRLNMFRSPKAVILKGELLDSTHMKKMCDCIIFRSDTKIVLVELRHKSIDPRSIHEKLRNGACAAMKIWSDMTNKKTHTVFSSRSGKLRRPCSVFAVEPRAHRY